MNGFKKLHLPLILLLLNICRLSVSEQNPVNYCGRIRIRTPFLPQNSSHSLLLSRMILCKSDNLYFRTSIGLFPISSIDYPNKLLTVSHRSCSSSSHFLSPLHLSAGFPHPSSPNSLLLSNCSNQSTKLPFSPCNNTQLSGLCDTSSCFLIQDADKLERSFHPKLLNCTHYSRVYKDSENFEVGTRISFDIPDHAPNPCKECEKPDGNCGAGLRCVCHPKVCKDKVISVGSVVKPCWSSLVYLVFLIYLMDLLPSC